MSGAYLMLFAMIFLGIMGAVNVILFIGNLGTPDAPPVSVTPDGWGVEGGRVWCEVEGKVRAALKATDGKVIINAGEELLSDSEFAVICRNLIADCPRVTLRATKKKQI